MDRVAVMPDHERLLRHLLPVRPRWCHPSVEESLEHRGGRLRILAQPVEHHVAEQPGPARHEPGAAAHQARDRSPEREAHQQRREGDGAAEQRVVEHGHLDQHALHPLRCGGGGLERHVGAQRGPADHRLLHLGVVKQRDRLTAEGQHAVVPHLGRAIGFAVAEQVEAQHPEAAVRKRFRQWRVHLAREQKARQQHHDAVAVPVLVVHEAMALELEIPGHHSRPQ